VFFDGGGINPVHCLLNVFGNLWLLGRGLHSSKCEEEKEMFNHADKIAKFQKPEVMVRQLKCYTL
jgi:hypothetical protein